MGSEESRAAGPCAFLFDGNTDGVPAPQLSQFIAAVLAALSEVDPQGRTHSQMRIGVPSLSKFAERMTAVRGFATGSGRTISHDVDTYKYAVWEWLDSLKQGWSSVDPHLGQEVFRAHTGECVAFSAFHHDIREAVDAELQAAAGYVGCFALDPGNPVHRGGFFDLLIYAAAITSGDVMQDRSIEGHEDWPLEGAEQFKPNGLIWKDFGWLGSEGPRGLPRVTLSERGSQAATSLAKKHVQNVEARVLEEIERVFSMSGDRKVFEFESVGDAADVLEAIMREGKFTEYLFNRAHRKGGSKAAFVIEELGIDPEDWRYLAAQFYFGLLMAQPEALKLKQWETGYGVRFNVTLRVRNRSGRTAILVTGWNMNPGKLPSLSTALPGERDAKAVEPGDPPILPPGLRTDADWSQLWNWANAAGVIAGETVVPTPMYLVESDPVSEGECGSAVVLVPDARAGLARWLLQHGPGKTGRYGGAVVFSPLASQSVDRATAWARAVVSILRLNNIQADFESHLN